MTEWARLPYMRAHPFESTFARRAIGICQRDGEGTRSVRGGTETRTRHGACPKGRVGAIATRHARQRASRTNSRDARGKTLAKPSPTRHREVVEGRGASPSRPRHCRQSRLLRAPRCDLARRTLWAACSLRCAELDRGAGAHTVPGVAPRARRWLCRRSTAPGAGGGRGHER
ncbi:hypothetical protein OH77DRAFT_338461 [Trametes cingulata]|nr:hypothetical protein OH77DRAFT_338461 [Trametes cingulata]